MKKLGAIITVILFLIITIASCIYLDLVHYAAQPAANQAADQVVSVRPGQDFKAFSRHLHHIGIIRHPAKFQLLARLKGYDKTIKAGEYLLAATMPPDKILSILVGGKVILYRLTVPEGYTLVQIADLVDRAGLADATAFLKAATDANLARTMGIDAPSFEGYLFPETYYFPKGVTPSKIVTIMAQRFWSVFKPEWKKQAELLGLSIHQVTTLASMIEKETGAAFERPMISSVFHNRLKRGMRLESDPTVIYGIKNYNGNITRKHLSTRTPYNTYMIKGLPPGPIANFGIKALEAALYPADTRYLYFVSKKDRTHHFSTNIKDHNRAVRKYQLRR